MSLFTGIKSTPGICHATPCWLRHTFRSQGWKVGAILHVPRSESSRYGGKRALGATSAVSNVFNILFLSSSLRFPPTSLLSGLTSSPRQRFLSLLLLLLSFVSLIIGRGERDAHSMITRKSLILLQYILRDYVAITGTPGMVLPTSISGPSICPTQTQ